ncbi:Arginase-2, mitochondrial [Myotis davidii]|uniref:Arginase-2, mitochondrial n=1 Tax=Myotis davidii TaxID=225400 RepID=L5M460_MYODS|nr:Arginase-2, mitochondrial [Myotis davidii]
MFLSSSLSHLRTQLHFILEKSVCSMAVIGAPFSRGQKRKGVDYGPAAIREAGVMKRLFNLGCGLKDFGDLSFTPVPKENLYNNLIANCRSVGLTNQELSEVGSRAVSGSYSCVTGAEDHSLAIGTISGHSEGMYITEEIHNTELLSALDLVEVNPQLAASDEEAKTTAGLAVDVIASIFGPDKGRRAQCL